MSKWKEQRAAEIEAERKKQEEEIEEPPTLDEVEAEFEEEVDAMQQAFRDRAAKERTRFQNVCDTNIYFVVCFTTYEQLEECCEMIGQDPGLLYVDGREFARNVKRALKSPDFVPSKMQPFNKDYTERALEKDSKWYKQ